MLKNLIAELPLANGGVHPLEGYQSGKELIQEWVGNDWGAPPTALVIEAKTADGQMVRITIPYNETSPASASIVGE